MLCLTNCSFFIRSPILAVFVLKKFDYLFLLYTHTLSELKIPCFPFGNKSRIKTSKESCYRLQCRFFFWMLFILSLWMISNDVKEKYRILFYLHEDKFCNLDTTAFFHRPYRSAVFVIYLFENCICYYACSSLILRDFILLRIHREKYVCFDSITRF